MLKGSKTSLKKSSEIFTNETEMPKERYISPAEMQKIIDDVRLI